jgi:16S rRNA (uracil1498-N3)-methyltransferase
LHRFFVPPESIVADVVAIPRSKARQIARVLRLSPGDEIVVLDNTGDEYDVTLTEISADNAVGRVTDRRHTSGEPRRRIVLYQALLKSDKFELVLQKCTELGVAAFVPFASKRTVVRERSGDHTRTRRDRWLRIVEEAAEQSHRGRLPKVRDPITLLEACEQANGVVLMPWEDEHSTGLRQMISKSASIGSRDSEIGIVIGPEGGFSEGEVESARERGVTTVSLGSRILRAETAAIATASAVLYELGELGT